MKTETKRVTVYDWLRLIATIWVVLGHSDYIVMDSLCGGVNYSLPENVSPVYYSAGLTFCGAGCVLVVLARTAGVCVISSFMGDLISVLKRKIETVSINRREASKE